MSTKAQVKTQAKTPAASEPSYARQPPLAMLELQEDRPDCAAQLEGAARLGHSLEAFSVWGAAPGQSQAMPLIQRQPVPEDEDEEEELQLQRKPAALQRQDDPEKEEEEDELQMQPDTPLVGLEGGPVPPAVETAIKRARGGGRPLDGATQAQLGEALGHDFSDVRVHTNVEADALNQHLSARAFTTGQDIFFRQGEYDPSSGSGRELLTHELTHVVQQSSGRITGGRGGMSVRPAGDAFEQEANVQAQSNRRGRDPISSVEQTQTRAINNLLIQPKGGRRRQSEASGGVWNPIKVLQRTSYMEAAKELYESGITSTEQASKKVGKQLKEKEAEGSPIQIPVKIQKKIIKIVNGVEVEISFITPKGEEPEGLGKAIKVAEKAIKESLDALGKGTPPKLIRVLISQKGIDQQAFVTRSGENKIYTIVTNPTKLFEMKELSVPGQLAKSDKTKFAEASITHEMGHLLHAFQDPVLFNAAVWGKLGDERLQDKERKSKKIVGDKNEEIMNWLMGTFPKKIKLEPWNYALNKNIAEVVAEVYTALINRKKVPPAFAKVYVAYRGIRGGQIDVALTKILEGEPKEMTPDDLPNSL